MKLSRVEEDPKRLNNAESMLGIFYRHMNCPILNQIQGNVP